ncbi:MAG: TlpA disulfide reductase family protein [Thermoanaerobaculia bacterium]
MSLQDRSGRWRARLAASLLGLLLAAAPWTAAAEPGTPRPRAAAAAQLLPGPDFQLLGLDEELHRLSDGRGKVVLVNFWATWCTACRQEIPGLNSLYQELAGQGVEILGIATDKEGAAKVAPYAEEMKIRYPILLDPEALSTSIFGGIEVYPTSFILDRDGLIYASYPGAQAEAVFRDDLIYLLSAPPSPAAPLILPHND